MQQETPTTPTNATLRNKRKISPFWLLPKLPVSKRFQVRPPSYEMSLPVGPTASAV